MRFSKDDLPVGSGVELVLENCDVFCFPAEDVLELRLKAAKSENGFLIEDGCLVLAARAAETLSLDALRVQKEGLEPAEYDRFDARMALCCDICTLEICGEREKKIFFTGYDPVVDLSEMREMEYSNCPSLERDGEGNICILFGISSKSPKRTDNDYVSCIEGFSERFPKLKKVLRVKVRSVLCNGAGDLPFSPEGGLAVLTSIRNKRYKGSRADLLFYEVTELKFALFDGWGKDTEMTLSPMQDGRLFVSSAPASLFGKSRDFEKIPAAELLLRRGAFSMLKKACYLIKAAYSSLKFDKKRQCFPNNGKIRAGMYAILVSGKGKQERTRTKDETRSGGSAVRLFGGRGAQPAQRAAHMLSGRIEGCPRVGRGQFCLRRTDGLYRMSGMDRIMGRRRRART